VYDVEIVEPKYILPFTFTFAYSLNGS